MTGRGHCPTASGPVREHSALSPELLSALGHLQLESPLMSFVYYRSATALPARQKRAGSEKARGVATVQANCASRLALAAQPAASAQDRTGYKQATEVAEKWMSLVTSWLVGLPAGKDL